MSKKSKEKYLKKPERDSGTVSRKQSHVELVVSDDVSHHEIKTGFERLHFVHNALPEINYDEVNTSTVFLGKHLDHPFLISSMTGGYDAALKINHSLAQIAAEYQLAMSVGSTRQALEDDRFHETYRVVRREYPEGLLFSNIGAVEVAKLAAEHKIKQLTKIVDILEADALVIHLNPLQELLQPEGEPNFRGVLAGIEQAVNELGMPILVKEVGAGISRETAKRLLEVGVRGIDVAGAGGTSWAGVEILRRKKKDRVMLSPFWDWGIPTAEALIDIAPLKDTMTFGLISSGGITTGLDAAKSLALRADLVGVARPFIKALIDDGEYGLRSAVESFITQLKYSMFLVGCADIAALTRQQLRKD